MTVGHAQSYVSSHKMSKRQKTTAEDGAEPMEQDKPEPQAAGCRRNEISDKEEMILMAATNMPDINTDVTRHRDSDDEPIELEPTLLSDSELPPRKERHKKKKKSSKNHSPDKPSTEAPSKATPSS